MFEHSFFQHIPKPTVLPVREKYDLSKIEVYRREMSSWSKDAEKQVVLALFRRKTDVSKEFFCEVKISACADSNVFLILDREKEILSVMREKQNNPFESLHIEIELNDITLLFTHHTEQGGLRALYWPEDFKNLHWYNLKRLPFRTRDSLIVNAGGFLPKAVVGRRILFSVISYLQALKEAKELIPNYSLKEFWENTAGTFFDIERDILFFDQKNGSWEELLKKIIDLMRARYLGFDLLRFQEALYKKALALPLDDPWREIIAKTIKKAA